MHTSFMKFSKKGKTTREEYIDAAMCNHCLVINLWSLLALKISHAEITG